MRPFTSVRLFLYFRRHFLQDYDSCYFDRCKIEEIEKQITPQQLGMSDQELEQHGRLQLWLWQTHNAVSVRTKLERAGQPRKFERIRQAVVKG